MLWYTQDSANRNAQIVVSFFDCKDLYEKAYATKRLARANLQRYCDWRKHHRGMTDPATRAASVRLGALIRAQTRAEIRKFRQELAKADQLATWYKQQISPAKIA